MRERVFQSNDAVSEREREGEREQWDSDLWCQGGWEDGWSGKEKRGERAKGKQREKREQKPRQKSMSTLRKHDERWRSGSRLAPESVAVVLLRQPPSLKHPASSITSLPCMASNSKACIIRRSFTCHCHTPSCCCMQP